MIYLYNRLIIFSLLNISIILLLGLTDNNYRNCLIIKKVAFDISCETISKYEDGRKYYPNYKIKGLPDKFYIKKTPDLVIKSNHIKSIIIKRMHFAPPNEKFFSIHFIFDKSIVDKLFHYTKINLKKKIAIEINGKILSISTIKNPIRNEFIIFGIDKELNWLKNLLSMICKNIFIEKSK